MESSFKECNACVSRSRYQVKQCHFNRTTELLGRKWVLPLLFELCLKRKPLRFNALQKFLFPITPKVLTKRLRELEEEGLLERTDKSEAGLPVVEYALTEKSRELLGTLKALGLWSEKWHGRQGFSCPNAKRLSCLKL